MKVRDIMVPVYTTDFEKTIRDYEDLFGEKFQNKFNVDAIKISIARINKVLIIGGRADTLESLPKIKATLVVDSINEYLDYLNSINATIIQPPTKVPTGQNMIAKLIDGTIFEYVELNE